MALLLIRKGADIHAQDDEAIKRGSEQSRLTNDYREPIVEELLTRDPLMARHIKPSYKPSILKAYFTYGDLASINEALEQFTDAEIDYILSHNPIKRRKAANSD
jgi:hypothetical protein